MRRAAGRTVNRYEDDQAVMTTPEDILACWFPARLALGLAIDGLERGHYAQLATVWEKTFFLLPLGHSEQIALLERCVLLCQALVDEAPEHLRKVYAFSASQARGHRDVIARFGRHPHRNAVLGRTSTEDERAYLASGELVHRRSFQG